MISAIDYILDHITMYRLVLYVLIALVSIAAIFGLLGLLHYSFFSLVASSLFLVLICWASNIFIADAFDAPTNIESALITALILALIISPAQSLNDYMFLGWAGILAMASKYILAINKKHLFNPAAIAVVITAWALGESASWWVGTAVMAPFVAIGGYLLIRKLRFEDLAWSFFASALLVNFGFAVLNNTNLLTMLNHVFLSSFILFFGTIMVTEPLTLPPTNGLRMLYAAGVGALSVPLVHLGTLYFSPELALVVGNIFSYLMSPKAKLVLRLQQKAQVSSNVVDFLFTPEKKVSYAPGQYMEWTVPHEKADSRGNRRYFTLASSPTEATLRIGVKFYEQGSSYKKALSQLDEKTPIVAAQIAGDFTLPHNPEQKLAFIAGGIGITPFRSMIKYLIDTNQPRSIVLLYANKQSDEIVYKDIFDQAETQLGLKTVYTSNRLTDQTIREAVPDFAERIFYLSGPQPMVNAYSKLLKSMGVRNTHIKTDYFPGLA